jgi:hypothetical protein
MYTCLPRRAGRARRPVHKPSRNPITQSSTTRRLRVLIYKRTHTGDPTPEGIFGLSDCMGRVRAREYDAVIGVGGLSAEPQACGIAGRVTWVGVGPHRSKSIPVGYREPIVEFDRFALVDETGPMLDSIVPTLAHHLFGTHRRVVMSDGLNDTIQREIAKIPALVSALPPGGALRSRPKASCEPKRAKAGTCPSRKRSRIC